MHPWTSIGHVARRLIRSYFEIHWCVKLWFLKFLKRWEQRTHCDDLWNCVTHCFLRSLLHKAEGFAIIMNFRNSLRSSRNYRNCSAEYVPDMRRDALNVVYHYSEYHSRPENLKKSYIDIFWHSKVFNFNLIWNLSWYENPWFY